MRREKKDREDSEREREMESADRVPVKRRRDQRLTLTLFSLPLPPFLPNFSLSHLNPLRVLGLSGIGRGEGGRREMQLRIERGRGLHPRGDYYSAMRIGKGGCTLRKSTKGGSRWEERGHRKWNSRLRKDEER